jgi:hypothetical protein
VIHVCGCKHISDVSIPSGVGSGGCSSWKNHADFQGVVEFWKSTQGAGWEWGMKLRYAIAHRDCYASGGFGVLPGLLVLPQALIKPINQEHRLMLSGWKTLTRHIKLFNGNTTYE